MNAQQLMREFTRSHDRVTARVAALRNNPRLALQVRRLEEMERAIRSEMRQLASTTRQHAPGVVRELAESGFKTGAKQAGAGAVVDFSMINREAVERYASGLTGNLLDATDNVSRSAKTLVRETARNEGLRSMIEGATAQDAGRAMQDHLRDNGIFAVRYADGSRHGLGEYSQMAMRTTTAEAYNTSLVDGAKSEGTEFFEIFDGPDCGLEFHDDTELAAGLIVSGSVATSYPISHPNCRRAFGARPDIKTQEEADAGTPHVTEEQMAAQRSADEANLTSAQRARLERREAARGRERGTPRLHPSRQDRIDQYRQRVQGAGGSSTPAWKPAMTRAEADRWAAGSALPGARYHGTSAEFGERIRREGFSNAMAGSSTGNVGLAGRGHYFTSDQGYATVYARGQQANVLETRLNVQNPMPDSELWRFMKENRISPHPDDLAKVTEHAVGRGYDSIHIVNDAAGAPLPVDEIVVFSREQITVVTG